MLKRPGRLTATLYRFRTEYNTPGRQAAAIALGLFIGATPFIGFHLLLTLAFASMLRVNRLKAYLAANISNPFFAPFLYAAEIQVGAWLRTGHTYSTTMLSELRLGGLAIDILIGSAVIGAALAAAGAAVTYWAVRARGDGPEVAELIDAAAERYLVSSISAWEFARSKMRMDPVYLDVLKSGVLPREGVLLDLGCGQGLMLALLVAARDRFRARRWPPGWPTPPLDAELRGIELRPRVARRAQLALGSEAVIATEDLTRSSLPPCAAVWLFDVLHLMSREAQDHLLREIHHALAPGGCLIIREADAEGGLRFWVVRAGNRVNAIAQGRGRRKFQFDTEPGWRARLNGMGFRVERSTRFNSGPFANFLIVARRL
jgi:uncharacterized protein (DUF2062 family)/SAM-dependent methyltransferase